MTPSELYTKALQRLQVLAAGESPSAEDRALVSEKYTALHDQLLTLDLVSWGVADDIPDYVSLPVTMMLAWACAREFAASPQMMQELTLEGAVGLPVPSLAERQLRQQFARRYISTPAQSEYF